MTQSAPNPLPFAPGTVLAGKYRIERVVGHGGMGVVVEARHIALDERVALKFLLPEYATHPEASTRFLREARAAVRIKSEHVARVSDVGKLESGSPYMVMEMLDGSDLSSVLTARGPLPIPEAIDYVIQACEAVAEAHVQGIVHRDLKPPNMFLTRRRDGLPLVKVLDFGISKVVGATDDLTRTTAAIGSALYMSPEQMMQSRSVDHRTDIYSIGISLFQLLCGVQPFNADSLPQLCGLVLTGEPTPLRSLRPDVSDDLAAVIAKSYARERDARYQSIAEFVFALAPWAPPPTHGVIEAISRMQGGPRPGAPDIRMSMGSLSRAVAAQGPAPGPPLAVSMPSVVTSHSAFTSATGPVAPPRQSSGAGTKIALALGALFILGLGGGGLLLLRSALHGRTATAGAATSAATTTSAPGAPASAASASTSTAAAAPASAAPAEPPSASSSAPAADSASEAASAAPDATHPVRAPAPHLPAAHHQQSPRPASPSPAANVDPLAPTKDRGGAH